MPLARIITRHPEASSSIADYLRDRGYTVETVSPEEFRITPADVELKIDNLPRQEALARAKEYAGDVYVGADALPTEDMAGPAPRRFIVFDWFAEFRTRQARSRVERQQRRNDEEAQRDKERQRSEAMARAQREAEIQARVQRETQAMAAEQRARAEAAERERLAKEAALRDAESRRLARIAAEEQARRAAAEARRLAEEQMRRAAEEARAAAEREQIERAAAEQRARAEDARRAAAEQRAREEEERKTAALAATATSAARPQMVERRARPARSREKTVQAAFAIAAVLAIGMMIGWAAANPKPASPLPLNQLMNSQRIEQQLPFTGATVRPPAPRAVKPDVIARPPAAKPAPRPAAPRRRARNGGVADDVVIRHYTTPAQSAPVRNTAEVKKFSDLD